MDESIPACKAFAVKYSLPGHLKSGAATDHTQWAFQSSYSGSP